MDFVNRKLLVVGSAVIVFLFIVGVLVGLPQDKVLKQQVAATPAPTGGDIVMNDNNQGELQIEDLQIGDGDEALAGKKVTVNYKGTLTNGKQFDSSYDRGVPFSFNLGAGEVIAGWDQGVVGMKVGGKRKLVIPPQLAYGAVSPSPDIPPNSTLVFEVELLKVE